MTLPANSEPQPAAPGRWQRLGSWFSREEVQHILFWTLAFVLLLMLEWPAINQQTILALLLNLSFYATIVYLNTSYLFPQYLLNKQPLRYIGWLVLTALLTTPLRSYVINLIFERPLIDRQQLLTMQLEIFLSHLTVGIVSTMLKIAVDWARTTRERQQLEAEHLQSELRFLRSQINPHFLFNTLNSLYALTLKKSDEAPATVLRLSDMMRYMLYESNARLVPLQKEIEYIRNYLDLERLRHGKNADISFVLEGDPTNLKVAPLLFITFIENAFKHGMGRLLNEGYVHIYLTIDRGELRFHLENSKPDKADNSLPYQPGGIGLINVRRRLALLYPESHDLHILQTAHTYSVDLCLNLNRAEAAIITVHPKLNV